MKRRVDPARLRGVSLQSLRAYRKVLELGSVTAAAQDLGLSQPATSRAIAQLEEQVGFEMFHRDRGKLVPTTDGLLLLDEIKRVLESLDRVSDLARDIAAFRVGQLKLVAPPSFLEAIMPAVVAEFLHRFPKVRLTMDSHGVEAAKALIASRAVDAGFVKLPHNRADLTAQTILVSGTVCVLKADHPLAGQVNLSPAHLHNVPLILLGLGTSLRGQVESAFADQGVNPLVCVETHTVASACALAERGVGVAIVNAGLAAAYTGEGLVARDFLPNIPHEYAFVTAASAPPSRLASAFLDCCRDVLPK